MRKCIVYFYGSNFSKTTSIFFLNSARKICVFHLLLWIKLLLFFTIYSTKFCQENICVSFLVQVSAEK